MQGRLFELGNPLRRGTSTKTSPPQQTAIRKSNFERSVSPPPTELDVCEEEIVVFRDEAVRSSGGFERVTVEAHVEPEPRKKRQRFTGESAPLTSVRMS